MIPGGALERSLMRAEAQAQQMRHTRQELRMAVRFPDFDPDQARAVLNILARGVGITAIGDIAGFPPYWVINQWRSRFPDFDEACVTASKAAADTLIEECLEIADDDGRHPANKALSIAVRERMAKVLHRKKYDPATRVEVTDGKRAASSYTREELAAIIREHERENAVDTGGDDAE